MVMRMELMVKVRVIEEGDRRSHRFCGVKES